jgi:glutathione S-transferase
LARGQVRDLRVRWALEGAVQAYATRHLSQGDQDAPEYRAMLSFGRVPIYEDKGQVLFETGALVLHSGSRSEALLAKDPAAWDRAAQRLIAPLNSVEPSTVNVAALDLFYAAEEWARLRRPGAREFAQRRPDALFKALTD